MRDFGALILPPPTSSSSPAPASSSSPAPTSSSSFASTFTSPSPSLTSLPSPSLLPSSPSPPEIIRCCSASGTTNSAPLVEGVAGGGGATGTVAGPAAVEEVVGVAKRREEVEGVVVRAGLKETTAKEDTGWMGFGSCSSPNGSDKLFLRLLATSPSSLMSEERALRNILLGRPLLESGTNEGTTSMASSSLGT